MNRPKRLGTLVITKKRKLSLKIDLNLAEPQSQVDEHSKDKHLSCSDLKHLDFLNNVDEEGNVRKKSSKAVKIVKFELTKQPSLKKSSNIFRKVYSRKKSRILNPFFASKNDESGLTSKSTNDVKRFKFQNMKTIRKEFFIDLVASSIKSLNLKKSHFMNNDAIKRVLIDEIIKPIDGAVKKPATKHRHRHAIKNTDSFLSSIRNLISNYTVDKEPQINDNSKRDINVCSLFIELENYFLSKTIQRIFKIPEV